MSVSSIAPKTDVYNLSMSTKPRRLTGIVHDIWKSAQALKLWCWLWQSFTNENCTHCDKAGKRRHSQCRMSMREKKKKKKNDEKKEEKKDEKQKRKRKEKKGRVNEWARLRNSVMTDECFWINAPLIIECAGPKLCVCIYTYIYYIYMTRRTWSDTPQHTRRNGGKIYSVLSLYITSNQLGPSKTQSYVGKG